MPACWPVYSLCHISLPPPAFPSFLPSFAMPACLLWLPHHYPHTCSLTLSYLLFSACSATLPCLSCRSVHLIFFLEFCPHTLGTFLCLYLPFLRARTATLSVFTYLLFYFSHTHIHILFSHLPSYTHRHLAILCHPLYHLYLLSLSIMDRHTAWHDKRLRHEHFVYFVFWFWHFAFFKGMKHCGFAV